jgi:hypothetical protein
VRHAAISAVRSGGRRRFSRCAGRRDAGRSPQGWPGIGSALVPVAIRVYTRARAREGRTQARVAPLVHRVAWGETVRGGCLRRAAVKRYAPPMSAAAVRCTGRRARGDLDGRCSMRWPIAALGECLVGGTGGWDRGAQRGYPPHLAVEGVGMLDCAPSRADHKSFHKREPPNVIFNRSVICVPAEGEFE